MQRNTKTQLVNKERRKFPSQENPTLSMKAYYYLKTTDCITFLLRQKSFFTHRKKRCDYQVLSSFMI